MGPTAPTDSTYPINDEQRKLWNGLAGRGWVEVQEVLDQALKPFEDLLIKAVRARVTRPLDAGSAQATHQVLDVGCGTGSTILAASRLPGLAGHCMGIDISEPMLACARARAEREGMPVSFVCADAQNYSFEPASFDMIISRFGVMFFEDPAQAFMNLRRAAKTGCELRFAAWRSATENPFMTAAERAAAPLLQNVPPRRPDAPGQFAFADEKRIYSLLKGGGWTDVDVQPIDVACAFPAKELVPYLMWMGPVGRILQESDERTRTEVLEAIRIGFDSYVHGDEVGFVAACWMVSARAP